MSLLGCPPKDEEQAASTQEKKEVCDNGVDDDDNGQIDCADTACNCQAKELCDNGMDDDGDGKIDCADVMDCLFDPACTLPEDCSNGIDDDNDQLVDCLDSDCAGSSECSGTGGSGGSGGSGGAAGSGGATGGTGGSGGTGGTSGGSGGTGASAGSGGTGASAGSGGSGGVAGAGGSAGSSSAACTCPDLSGVSVPANVDLAFLLVDFDTNAVILRNPTSAAVDAAGWTIFNSNPGRNTVIPTGTVVPPGGHLLVALDDDISPSASGPSFDDLMLVESDDINANPCVSYFTWNDGNPNGCPGMRCAYETPPRWIDVGGNSICDAADQMNLNGATVVVAVASPTNGPSAFQAQDCSAAEFAAECL